VEKLHLKYMLYTNNLFRYRATVLAYFEFVRYVTTAFITYLLYHNDYIHRCCKHCSKTKFRKDSIISIVVTHIITLIITSVPKFREPGQFYKDTYEYGIYLAYYEVRLMDTPSDRSTDI
jgi:hypothetical protein